MCLFLINFLRSEEKKQDTDMKVQGLNINLKTKHITIKITEQYMTLLPQTHEPSLYVHTLEF